jgi:peptide/nickel transport system permease protein
MMGRLLLRRLGFLGLTLLLTSVLIFSATQFLPGDVARVILGREAGEEAVAALREELGLDRPAIVQYGSWLGRFVRGDWGTSFGTGLAVRPLVVERLRNSLMLAAVALVLAVPLSVFLGVWAGLREHGIADSVISLGSLAIVGLPEFVTGVVLIELLAHRWHLLPATSPIAPGTGFWEALPSLILPALTATFVLLAYIARLTRAEVAEQMRRPYVRTAVLKGLPRHVVVVKHVLRNALLPTITVIAISFGWLIGGIIVIENVFNYPGLGRLLLFAIDRRDFPLMQAIAIVVVLGVVFANLIADLLYSAVNPRIRYK